MELAALRYPRFAEPLTARLNELQAAGQPEIPRLLGLTLLLLNLLLAAHAFVPHPRWRCGAKVNATGS
jgi:hypothetical protein